MVVRSSGEIAQGRSRSYEKSGDRWRLFSAKSLVNTKSNMLDFLVRSPPKAKLVSRSYEGRIKLASNSHIDRMRSHEIASASVEVGREILYIFKKFKNFHPIYIQPTCDLHASLMRVWCELHPSLMRPSSFSSDLTCDLHATSSELHPTLKRAS